MTQLAVVSDYVTEARRIMQDTGLGGNYRYPDADIVAALNDGLLEALRIRPDLFMATTGTTFTPPAFVNNDGTAVPMDLRYRMSLVYYICGICQIRDMEDVQDNRATSFLKIFQTQLGGGG